MKRIIMMLMASALMGCATHKHFVDPGTYPATDPEKIAVIDTKDIQGDYDVIGECVADGLLDDIRVIKQEAAQLGADAVTPPKLHRNGLLKSLAIKYK